MRTTSGRLGIEAQLHRAGHLVDILPAGARGADEMLLQLGGRDLNAVVYAEHGNPLTPPAPQ